MGRRLSLVRSRISAADLVLTVAIGVVAQIEVWTLEEPGVGRGWLSAIAFAMTAPLFWRRQRPLVSTAIVMAALIASLPWEIPDRAIFPTLAAAVAMYSVAAHSTRRAAAVGAAVVIVPIFVHQVGVQRGFADFVFIAAMLGAVWLAGLAVRSHREQAARLAERSLIVEREAEASRQAAVAEERLRIARELLDIVAHSVSMMTVQAAAERRTRPKHDPVHAPLQSIEHTGRQAMTEMRRLLGVLRAGNEDVALAPQPGMEHVDLLLETARTAGVPVEWHVEGTPVALPAGVDLAAYRIIQEALTNVTKHAHASRADVTVRYRRDALELEIRDDGRGCGTPSSGGHGLIGMRERVILYGGELHTGEVMPHGFAVRARFPLTSSDR